MNLKTTILTLSLLSFITLPAQEKEDWKLIKNENNIRVYSMPDTTSKMKIIKVETEAETDLSTLVSLIEDAENQVNWVFNCKHAEILYVIDSAHWYYYSQTDAPWPVSDRDVVTKVTYRQNKEDKTVVFKSEGAPDFIPPKPGYVRIPRLLSYWIFQPLENGKIKIVFKLKIDLGGVIPQWLTNMVVSKGPYITMENLLFEIEKPKYKNAYCRQILEE